MKDLTRGKSLNFWLLVPQTPKSPHLSDSSLGSVTLKMLRLLLHPVFWSVGVKTSCSGSCLQNLICFPAHHFPVYFITLLKGLNWLLIAASLVLHGLPLPSCQPSSAPDLAQLVTAPPAPHKANV